MLPSRCQSWQARSHCQTLGAVDGPLPAPPRSHSRPGTPRRSCHARAVCAPQFRRTIVCTRACASSSGASNNHRAFSCLTCFPRPAGRRSCSSARPQARTATHRRCRTLAAQHKMVTGLTATFDCTLLPPIAQLSSRTCRQGEGVTYSAACSSVKQLPRNNPSALSGSAPAEHIKLNTRFASSGGNSAATPGVRRALKFEDTVCVDTTTRAAH